MPSSILCVLRLLSQLGAQHLYKSEFQGGRNLVNTNTHFLLIQGENPSPKSHRMDLFFCILAKAGSHAHCYAMISLAERKDTVLIYSLRLDTLPSGQRRRELSASI
jgi:hypothetical protein